MTAQAVIQWESWPSEAHLQVTSALRRSHFDSSAVQTVCDIVSASTVIILEPLHRFSTVHVAGYQGLGAFHQFASCLVAVGAKIAVADLLFCLRDSKTVAVDELLLQYPTLCSDACDSRYHFLPAATYMISDPLFDWIKTRWSACTSLENIGYAIGVLHPIDRPSLVRSLCEYLLFYREITLGPFVFCKSPDASRSVKGSIDIVRGLIEMSTESTDIIGAEIDCIWSLVACDDLDIQQGFDAVRPFGPVQEILYQFALRLIRRWQHEHVFLSDLLKRFASCHTYIAVIDLILSAIADKGIPILVDVLSSSEGIGIERADVAALIDRGYCAALIATTLCSDRGIFEQLNQSAPAITEALRYVMIRGTAQQDFISADAFNGNPFFARSVPLTLVSAILSLRSFIAGFRSDSYLELCRMLAARMPQWVEFLQEDREFVQVLDSDQLADFLCGLDRLGAEPEFPLLPWSLRNTFVINVEQLRFSMPPLRLCQRSHSSHLGTPVAFIAGLILASSFSLLSDYGTELVDFLAAGNEQFALLLPSEFWGSVLMAFAKVERQSFLHVTDIWLDFFLQKIAVDSVMVATAADIESIIKMTAITFESLPIGDICQALYHAGRICGDTFMVLESLDDAALLHYAEFAPNSLALLIGSYLEVDCCWEWSQHVSGLKCARIIAALLSTFPKRFVKMLSDMTPPTNIACLAAGLSYQLIRFPDSYCCIMKQVWPILLSVFGIHGETELSFSALVDAIKCGEPDLSQLASMLMITCNPAYCHIRALYSLSPRPVEWLLERSKLNPESEQLILSTLGGHGVKPNWIEQFRSNPTSISYDSSTIMSLLQNSTASDFVNILPELATDRCDLAPLLSQDLFALISSSRSVLRPCVWHAAKIIVAFVDTTALEKCLGAVVDSRNFVNLENLLNVVTLVAERGSNLLTEVLSRISTCPSLESPICCRALEILTICASAGVGIEWMSYHMAQHASYYFQNRVLSKYACQVLAALNSTHAAPVALRAALASRPTSPALLRFTFFSDISSVNL